MNPPTLSLWLAKCCCKVRDPLCDKPYNCCFRKAVVFCQAGASSAFDCLDIYLHGMLRAFQANITFCPPFLRSNLSHYASKVGKHVAMCFAQQALAAADPVDRALVSHLCSWAHHIAGQDSARCADDLAEIYQRVAFERLLRSVLSLPQAPAVIVVMVVIPSTDFGRSVESELMTIAQHYQLPLVSTRCASVPCCYKSGRCVMHSKCALST